MTTGDGIFFGIAFISLIWLYSVSRDRWKWKRIFKWGLLLVVFPLVGIGLWKEFSDYLSSRPQVEQDLWGIKIALSVDDLIFLKGKTEVEEEKDRAIYFDSGILYVVRLKDSKVRIVSAWRPNGEGNYFPKIQGISFNSTQANIEKRFGPPDHIERSNDGTARIYSYMKYQVFFQLEKGKVIELGVFDPRYGPVTREIQ
jgi:hypothetical protein